MFLLSNLLGGYDAVVSDGIISFTLKNDFNVHIKPLVFKPRNGVIISSRDKYFWSKSTIASYLKRYTVRCGVTYKPLKNKLKPVSILPTGLGYSIREIVKNSGIADYNKFIYFSSNDERWYLFTSAGIITGFYTGEKSFALPTDMVLSYTDYQSAEIVIDSRYVGISFSDNIFENKIFIEGQTFDSFFDIIKMYFKPMMVERYMLINETEFETTPEWDKFGTHRFNLCVSPAGIRYKAKEFSFYKLSVL